jgi:GNAT superfamily N-acetyltransferase
MTITDGEAFWRRYEPFHLKMGLGFWMPALVTLPFGVMSVIPSGGKNILSGVDLTRWNHQDILDEAEAVSQRWGNPVEFIFSSSWAGDVAAFKALLSARGYQRKQVTRRLVREGLDGVEAAPLSDCAVELTHDAQGFEDVFRQVFPDHLPVLPAMARNVASRTSLLETPVFLARDKGGRSVGIVGACHEGEFGYMHSLGVVADCRGRGVGRHLVRECLLHIRQEGVRYVTSGVPSTNAASLALQERLGYRVFADSETWSQ